MSNQRCLYFTGARLMGASVGLFDHTPEDENKTSFHHGVADICRKKIFPPAHDIQIIQEGGQVLWQKSIVNNGRYDSYLKEEYDEGPLASEGSAWAKMIAAGVQEWSGLSNPDCPMEYWGLAESLGGNKFHAALGWWVPLFSLTVGDIPPNLLTDSDVSFTLEWKTPVVPGASGILTQYYEDRRFPLDGSIVVIPVDKSDLEADWEEMHFFIGPATIGFGDAISFSQGGPPYSFTVAAALSGDSLPRLVAHRTAYGAHVCWPAEVFDAAYGAAVIDTKSGLVVGPFIEFD